MSISTAIEIVVIFLLILANGFFAASEIAVVSGRRGRLQQQADAGKTRARQALDLKMLARKPLFVSENHYADDLLTTFGHTGIHMALVLNESSQVIGLVTLEDLVEELVGEIQSEYQARDEQAFAQRVDGSWLVDGMVAYDGVWERIGIPAPDDEKSRNDTTLAELFIVYLGHNPALGDLVTIGDVTLEVVDMDGKRIDRVLISRQK